MHTYALNNYLKQNPTSFDSEFNKKIKDFLNKKKGELSLNGVFYTYYSKTNDYDNHIKIGFFSEKEISNIEKLKNELESLLNDKLKKQGDTAQGILYLPVKANELTGLIACYSFELLKFVEDKNNEQISGIYQAVISGCVKKFPYLLTVKIEPIETSDLDSFCSDFKRDILDNAVDLQRNFWFIMERLFHHCNNSNQKFGDNEKEIFNKLIGKINSR
jgi:hypothetical protein